MDLKSPVNFEEQIAKLQAHGMKVTDCKKAEEVLAEINYYRFSGYAFQYRIQADKSDLVSGITFDMIHHIYQFDESLRDILRKYLEKVEIYFRTLISYNFSMVKCLTPPYDQHYDENNFFNKKGYSEVMDSFNKEKNYYKDSLIVKHHKLKYDGRMPLWVIVELMSFSNISKLYNSMYLSEKDLIAKKVGTGVETLENHLHCLSVLRNKCAHAARLYNTEFNPPAKFTTRFLRNHREVKINSLFAYILVLLKRLPQESTKRALISDVTAVINEYEQDIDLSKIGFPNNYEDLMMQMAKK